MSTNLGIDFALSGPKLYGTIELYNKHGIDIVGEIDLPRLTGTSLQEFNTAEILNRVELNLNYDNITINRAYLAYKTEFQL